MCPETLHMLGDHVRADRLEEGDGSGEDDVARIVRRAAEFTRSGILDEVVVAHRRDRRRGEILGPALCRGSDLEVAARATPGRRNITANFSWATSMGSD